MLRRVTTVLAAVAALPAIALFVLNIACEIDEGGGSSLGDSDTLDGDSVELSGDSRNQVGDTRVVGDARVDGDARVGEPCDYNIDCLAGEQCSSYGCEPAFGAKDCPVGNECNAASELPDCHSSGVCAECTSPDSCPSWSPFCVNSHCVGCTQDNDCGSGVCADDKFCRECRTSEQCTDPLWPLCVTGNCRQCEDASDCTSVLKPYCSNASACIECKTDGDCSDPVDAKCHQGQCGPCGGVDGCSTIALSVCSFTGCTDCLSDYQCKDRWTDYTCVRTTPDIGIDNACSKSCDTAADCSEGHKCIDNMCAECEGSGDCPASAPICGRGGFCYQCETTEDCADGLTCNYGEGTCIECISDNDCTNPLQPGCKFNKCYDCTGTTDCTRFGVGWQCKSDGQCASP